MSLATQEGKMWLDGALVEQPDAKVHVLTHSLHYGWTAHFSSRFAGQPFKSVAINFQGSAGPHFQRRGEFVATATGVEGSLVYAVSALLRDEIEAHGSATFYLDLLPDHSPERVLAEVRHPRGTRSLSSHLKSRLGLEGIKMGILYEQLGKERMNEPLALAAAIKALPVTVVATRPIDEAISTAGGVALEALDEHLMLRQLPGGVLCGRDVGLGSTHRRLSAHGQYGHWGTCWCRGCSVAGWAPNGWVLM